MTDVIVIGGGLNGLVAGALAREAEAVASICSTQRRRSAAPRSRRSSRRDSACRRSATRSARSAATSCARCARSRRPRVHHARSGADDARRRTAGRIVLPSRSGADGRVDQRGLGRGRRPVDASSCRRRSGSRGVIATLDRQAPPPIDAIAARATGWRLAGGRPARARRSARRDLTRLARWMPMSVADLTGEWFENGSAAGGDRRARDLRQSRRAAVGRHRRHAAAAARADPMPVGSGVTAKGGPGALARCARGDRHERPARQSGRRRASRAS